MATAKTGSDPDLEPRAAARRTTAAPAKRSGPGVEEHSRRYHHGNLREELIRCGKERLKTEPLDELSLRKIAADAGVSQVAPKHHFGNKAGLFAAIAASGFRDLTEFRFSRMRPGMTAEQRLRVLLSSYVIFALQNPALFQLMFAPRSQKEQPSLELDESSSQSYHLLARAVEDFLREKNRNRGDLRFIADASARGAWASMHGLATLMLERRINPLGAARFNKEQLIEQTIDLVFAGMLTS